MGNGRIQALRVQFDGKLKLEFRGPKITSDSGLPPFRELDEPFRLTEKGPRCCPIRVKERIRAHTA